MTVRKNSFTLKMLSLLLCSGGMIFAQTGDSASSRNQTRVSAQPAASTSNQKIQQIIFEEQRIEGKIRRPQLVLIKADERPEFAPMVMQSAGKTRSIAGLVDDDLIGYSENSGQFKFEGTRLIYPAP